LNIGASIVAPITTHPQQVGFCAIVLHRMKGLVEWLRQQPAPANNVIDEALQIAFAMAGGGAFDIQRVYELVGTETGSNGVMVWQDGEAKIIGKTIDLVLRAIARPDQAAFCAGRVAELMIALHQFDFSDPAAVETERQYLLRLAQAIAAQRGPVGLNVMSVVPEYRRGALAQHAQFKVGQDWFLSFGPSAASFPGPNWQDTADDSHLKDGRDPKTTRTGHVEGW
jgi:hypothetical protein